MLPAVVAAAAMAVVWKLSRRAEAAWLVGISLGYVVGHWGLSSQGVGFLAAIAQTAQPHEARDWLPLAVVSAAAIEALALGGGRAAVVGWVLRAAWCVLLPWRLLTGSVYLPNRKSDLGFDSGAWTTTEAAAWLGGTAILLALVWLAAKLMPEHSVPRLRSSLASFVALGATATVALSGSLTMGQLLGVLTAVLVGCGIAASVLRLDHGPEAGAGPLLAVFGGVLVIARFLFDPELNLFYALMLLVAMSAAVGWIGPASWISKRAHAAVRVVICVAALALTVAPAARDFAASQTEIQTNPYQNFQP